MVQCFQNLVIFNFQSQFLRRKIFLISTLNKGTNFIDSIFNFLFRKNLFGSSCLSRYQKSFRVGPFGCKYDLKFTCHPIRLLNCHHTIKQLFFVLLCFFKQFFRNFADVLDYVLAQVDTAVAKKIYPLLKKYD